MCTERPEYINNMSALCRTQRVKMTDNVISFPENRIIKRNLSPELKMEDVKDKLEAVKHTHVQETISLIAPMLYQQLSLAGFELIDDEDESVEAIKDTAFLIESIRSVLFKYYGLEHPFQKIAQNVFKAEESGLLSITDTLDLVLKMDEEMA